MPGGRRSDAARERAVLALLNRPTVEQAAAEAGVSERTLRRWLREDAEFRAAYAEARSAAVDDALRQLQRGAGIAVRALVRHAKDTDAGISIRAAQALLDQLGRLSERVELEARVAELERLHRENAGDADRRKEQHHGQQDAEPRRGPATCENVPGR
jgi:hypothetical protein